MKILSLSLCISFLAGITIGCTTYKGDRTAGTYSATTLGGDLSNLNHTPDGISGTLTHSESFKSGVAAVKGMFTGYLTASGLKYSLGKYYGQEGKVVDAGKTVELEKLRNAKSATEGQNALEALRIESAAAHAAP